MRQLRIHLHTSLEERHDGELLVQRVRTLPQDERHSSSIGTLYQPEMQLKQVEAGGNGVCQLRHHDNHPVEEDQGERHRLQRLRSLLQGPWERSTHPVEEGRCADKEEEAEGEAGPQQLQHQHPWQLPCPPPRCPPVHRDLKPVFLGALLHLLLQRPQHKLGPPVPNPEPLQLNHRVSSLFASLLLTTLINSGFLTHSWL